MIYISTTEQYEKVYKSLDILGLPYKELPLFTSYNALMRFISEQGANTLFITEDNHCYHIAGKKRYKTLLIAPDTYAETPNLYKDTVGVITKAMLKDEAGLCIFAKAVIQQTPVKQIRGKVHYLTAQHHTGNIDQAARYGAAKITMAEVSRVEHNFQYHEYASTGLPKVNEMLRDGLDLLEDDDILVISNTDICITPDFVATVKAWLSCTGNSAGYISRIEVDKFPGESVDRGYLLSKPFFEGIDTFVFTKSFDASTLITMPLEIGREGWDWAWVTVMGSSKKIPFRLCYHYKHDSDWTTDKGKEGNTRNYRNIALNMDFCLIRPNLW